MPTVVDALITTLALDATQFKAGVATVNINLKALTEATVNTGKGVVAAGAAMAEGQRRAGKEIEASTSGIVEGYRKVRNSLVGMLALFAGFRGVSNLTSEITHQDAVLGRLSYRMGMSTKELGSWQGAATRAGGTADGISQSIGGLAAKWEQFTQTGEGGGPIINALNRLGVSAKALDAGNLTAFNLEVANGLQQMDKRDRKATDLYGAQLGYDQGTIDFFRHGGAYVQDQLNRQQANAPTETDTTNAQEVLGQLDDMGNRVKSFARHLLNDLTPTLTRLMKAFGDWLDNGHLKALEVWMDQHLQAAALWVEKLGKSIKWDEVGARFDRFVTSFTTMIDRIAAWQAPEWLTAMLGGGSLKDVYDAVAHPGQNNYEPSTTAVGKVEEEAAIRNGVPVEFARKIFAMEGGVDKDGKAVVSSDGKSLGAGQLTADTAKEMNVTDRSDLHQAADGSTRYMRKMLDAFPGNEAAAAAAYNAGPNSAAVKEFARTGDVSVLNDINRKYVNRFRRTWFEGGSPKEPGKLDQPPVKHIDKPETGRDQPGDEKAEKPDLPALNRLLKGEGAGSPPSLDGEAEKPDIAGLNRFLSGQAGGAPSVNLTPPSGSPYGGARPSSGGASGALMPEGRDIEVDGAGRPQVPLRDRYWQDRTALALKKQSLAEVNTALGKIPRGKRFMAREDETYGLGGRFNNDGKLPELGFRSTRPHNLDLHTGAKSVLGGYNTNAVNARHSASYVTNTGPVTIHTQATDAKGIAASFHTEMQSRAKAAQADRGLI